MKAHISDEAADHALHAFFDVNKSEAAFTGKDRTFMRAALEAALPDILGEPAAWLISDKHGIKVGTTKDPASRDAILLDGWTSHPLYALKEPQP